MNSSKTYDAVVKDFRDTCWEPGYEPKATDLFACCKITPQTGIPSMNSPMELPDSQTGAS